eukprot:COSAG03_NODE_118_length_12325_cov_11.481515_9_plen_176_part_00
MASPSRCSSRPQGRGIYDELLTLSQFSRSSEYSVVDEGGATRNGCWHRPGIKLARHGADMAPTWHRKIYIEPVATCMPTFKGSCVCPPGGFKCPRDGTCMPVVCPLTRYHIVCAGGHKALCPPAKARAAALHAVDPSLRSLVTTELCETGRMHAEYVPARMQACWCVCMCGVRRA